MYKCHFTVTSQTNFELYRHLTHIYHQSGNYARMQAANRFQKALKRGGTTFGAWQVLLRLLKKKLGS